MIKLTNVLRYLCVLCVLFVCSVQNSNAACPANWHSSGENYFYLSDSQTDINEAEKSCSEFGGFLAKVSNQQQYDEVTNLLDQAYTNNLQQVWMFTYDNNYRYSKTRQVEWWWKYTGLTFKLYKTPTRGYQQIVNFMQSNNIKWLIKFSAEDEFVGWHKNFVLYGGDKNSSGTDILYHYQNSAFSSKLSPDRNPVPTLPYQSQSLYVPAIRTAIEGKSPIGQTKWYWDDGTPVNASSYPPSSKVECQTMTMHYFDNHWSLSPKSCQTKEKMYYTCQLNFAANVERNSCNATVLKVSWNGNLFSKVFQNSGAMKVSVTVSSPGYQETYETLFNSAGILASNLKQRTTYVITTRVWNNNCASVVSSSSTAKTGYGLPDAVSSALVVDKPDKISKGCFVELEKAASDNNVLGYQLIAINGESRTTFKEYLTKLDVNRSGLAQTVSILFPLNRLDLNTTYYFKIQAFSCQGLNKETDVSGYCVTAAVNPDANIGAVVIPIISILIVLALFVAVGLRFHKRCKHSQSPSSKENNQGRGTELWATTGGAEDQPRSGENGIPIYENTMQIENETLKDGYILAKDLEQTYMEMCSNDFQMFQNEYKDIVERSPDKPHEISRLPQNAKKNRYKNIYSFDDSLVVLNGDEDYNYINASHIKGYIGNRNYIATQAPKQSTVEDFWKMIWEQNTSVIVMLCRLKENNKSKCTNYWEKYTHENFNIETKFEDDMGEIVKRSIAVTCNRTREKRVVTQYQYKSWPDHGVPLKTTPMLYLMRMVNETIKQQTESPIVIHCSAGAGRTGTYIATDILCQQMDDCRKINPVEVVLRMRENRKDMIQNVKQYAFVYKLLVEWCVLPNTDMNVTEFTDFTSQNNWKESVNEEFRLLSRPFISQKFSENKEKENRTDDIEKEKQVENEQMRNINTFYIKTPYLVPKVIVAQDTSNGQEISLWKLILEKNVSCILELQPENSGEVTSSGLSTNVHYDGINVQIKNILVENDYVEKSLIVSNESQSNADVKYIQTTCWKRNQTSPNANSFINIISRISQFSKTDSTLVMTCRNESSRAASFLTFLNLSERLKSENRIDVFRTVKDLNDMRPNFVNNLSVYKSFYTLVASYLKEFETYSNYK